MKRIFLYGRFIACINTYLHVKFKNNLSGGKCIKLTNHQVCLSKNMTPGKDGKWNFFFKFEILATNID